MTSSQKNVQEQLLVKTFCASFNVMLVVCPVIVEVFFKKSECINLEMNETEATFITRTMTLWTYIWEIHVLYCSQRLFSLPSVFGVICIIILKLKYQVGYAQHSGRKLLFKKWRTSETFPGSLSKNDQKSKHPCNGPIFCILPRSRY